MNLHSPSSVYTQAQLLLQQIEITMQQQGLWCAQSPSVLALASTSPFCIDTMSFCEWLQFVFIVKMGALVKQQLPLPQNMAIHPMAEEAFKPLAADTRQLSELILAFDQLLTNYTTARSKTTD